MNPNASSWQPSADAPAFVPGGGGTPAPAPAENNTPSNPPATSRSESAAESEIDESDPLWQAVLRISNGDRAKAEKMLADPDQLAQYPEITAILENSAGGAGGGGGDDWEKDLATETEDKMKVDDKKEEPKKEEPKKEDDYDYGYDDEEEEEEWDPSSVKEGDQREHFNLVFIGHVDAGKSTLSGNILYLTENVDKRTIERYEKEAKERNRESWFLAFIMDTNEEERAKGKTVEMGKAHFETQVKRYTILDAPGHKNYVPNMIMGASQADVGVLVISARKGEFETGFDRGGQTREHAMLAKTLGVSYLIVVVNKMDDPTVQWKKERYEECVKKLRPFLKGCGFVIKKEVKFLPISGLSGANVKTEVDPSECPWWKPMYTSGENNTDVGTLIDMLDTLEIKGRNPDAPVRIPVLDRYNDRGTIAMGKVESGVIRPGMKVTIMPTKNTYKVDRVWANEEPVSAARPGENVLIKLQNAGTEDVRKGFVICTDPPCRAVDKIICKLQIMDLPDNTKIMTAGFSAIFHAHAVDEECTLVKIFETTNKKRQVQKGARYATVGMQMICMLQLERPTSVETFADMNFLGRFTLRTEGKTVAIGIITKLPPRKDDP